MIPAATTEFKHVVQLKNLPRTDVDLYPLLVDNLKNGKDVVLEWDHCFETLNKIFISTNVQNDIHLAVSNFSTEEMILAHPEWKEGPSNLLILGRIERTSPGKYVGVLRADGYSSFEITEYDVKDDVEIEIDINIRYIIRFNGKIEETYMVMGHSIKPALRLS